MFAVKSTGSVIFFIHYPKYSFPPQRKEGHISECYIPYECNNWLLNKKAQCLDNLSPGSMPREMQIPTIIKLLLAYKRQRISWPCSCDVGRGMSFMEPVTLFSFLANAGLLSTILNVILKVRSTLLCTAHSVLSIVFSWRNFLLLVNRWVQSVQKQNNNPIISSWTLKVNI